MKPSKRESVGQDLIDAAIAAREQAYAPYSGFRVGAAILADGGQIHVGCNVENASFGLTLCAERTAAAAAIVAADRNWQRMVLVSKGAVTPCGACRQFLIEFNRDLEIILVDADTKEIQRSVFLATLLPDTFEKFEPE